MTDTQTAPEDLDAEISSARYQFRRLPCGQWQRRRKRDRGFTAWANLWIVRYGESATARHAGYRWSWRSDAPPHPNNGPVTL